MAETVNPAPHNPVRPGWASLCLFLVAFAGFEAGKYGNLTLGMGFAGGAAPLLARLIPKTGPLAPVRRVADAVLAGWLAPAAVLVWFSVTPESTAAGAPGWTFGLGWLAHVAAAKALGTPKKRIVALAPAADEDPSSNSRSNNVA